MLNKDNNNISKNSQNLDVSSEDLLKLLDLKADQKEVDDIIRRVEARGNVPEFERYIIELRRQGRLEEFLHPNKPSSSQSGTQTDKLAPSKTSLDQVYDFFVNMKNLFAEILSDFIDHVDKNIFEIKFFLDFLRYLFNLFLEAWHITKMSIYNEASYDWVFVVL